MAVSPSAKKERAGSTIGDSPVRRRTRTESALVCVVSDNQLAAYYLLQLLAKDRTIRSCTPRDMDAQSKVRHAAVIFVLDNCGLELPLTEWLRGLRTRYSGARFIVLDKSQSDEEVLRMLWYGIHGFLAHSDVRNQLLPAIRSVSTGRMWVASELLHTCMMHAHETHSRDGGTALTQREEQIMELVKRRFSNREIGGMLRIRESTVKFHLSHILSKMRAESRRDLFNGKEALHKWAAFLVPSETSSKLP